jgi:excisionase family DNA binding protein
LESVESLCQRRSGLSQGTLNMSAFPQSEWLTAAEAAAYLKVKPRTLVRWARCRSVPAHRLSGTGRITWRFLRSELDAMLGTSSVGPAVREATA